MDKNHITGIVLAGGRGSRMGGVDKGLQLFNGQPLIEHALQRLQPQVGTMLINANRNLDVYTTWGTPVLADDLADFAGPLAGFLVGLANCQTPYLATVPCDTPRYPLDLVARLADALERENADISMASSPDDTGKLCHQPVFCLIKRELLTSLQAFTAAGGRKIGAWAAQHKLVRVPFNLTHDDTAAFYNANTLADLQQLEAVST
ncbi:MAG: molybdenum cofactor guanylyltransferase MobA [Burkholderiaceae bacterium]|nr:molybdenum cofactor guanylyltransferase MobA [Burkholderiaceae bacterium]